ncbi:unnamed protein product [Cunninghamella echinulata]
MRRNQYHCDVMVNIFKPTNTTTTTTSTKKIKNKKKATSPSKIKKYTTKLTNDRNDIPSILNKSLTITDDDNDDESDDPTTNDTNNNNDNNNDDNNSNNNNNNPSPQMITFPVHRFILASRSSYFHSLLYGGQVCEATNSTVLLPNDLFTSVILDIIIHYFYTDQLQIPQIPTTSNTTLTFQKQIDSKKYSLKKLQKVYHAAEYLGQVDSLCNACLYQMELLCHQFKCTCQYCAILLPSMLAFANKNQSSVGNLRSIILALYTDPIQAMPPLWSQKTFALLILSHLENDITTTSTSADHGYFILPPSLQALFYPSSSSSSSSSSPSSSSSNSQPNITTNEENNKTTAMSTSPSKNNNINNSTLANINENNHPSTITTSSTSSSSTKPLPLDSLLVDLVSMTLACITKHNAIHVLHSIHLCLSKIRSADPFPTWSQPSLAIINAILHHTIAMVSSNFDFYCVEYPILLSCVDGIGGAFSVDFLGFLLKRVLNDGIQDSNAATLYQGIVRDLIGRQEVVKNVAVDGVLTEARQQCADYLSHRWIGVKAQGGFQSIDKDILKMLAEDINVPYRTLSKPLESEFSAIFGFKPKSSSKYKSTTPDISVTEFNGKQFKSSTVTSGLNELAEATTKSKRRLSLGSLKYPRSSSSSSKNNINTRASIDLVPTDHNNQLNTSSSSLDTDERQSLSDNEAFTNSKHTHHRHLSFQSKRRSYILSRGSSSSSLTDVLLPTDTPTSSFIPSTTSSPNNNTNNNNNDNDNQKDELNSSNQNNNNNNNNHTNSSTTNNNNTNHNNNDNNNNSSSNNNSNLTSTSPPPRRSRLTFELPETPIRAKYTTQIPSKSSKRSSKHKYRWSLGGGSNQSASDSDDEENQILMPVIGAKVELLRRPLPTLGRIKFIGHVEFSKGTWVGVELESRLGQNDGSVDGIRYFQTDPQRGVFVKMDGLKLIAGPLKP